MRDRSLYALALMFCASSALGQSQTIGPNGEGSFIAGPDGVPVMVLNEANSWIQPLVVFKNSEIELIIPDIRTAGWAASYASAFTKEGTYFTYLYIYGVQSHRTIREALYVNTRTRIAVVIESAFTPPTRVDLCKPDPPMPIDRITAIVKNVSDSFHGQSLDDAIAEQSYTVARMAACSESPTSQDCTMSDAQYRAQHPRYPRARTPTEILLAQIAPMTARQPNESCNGVPTDEKPAPSPSGQNTDLGLYGIGNGVSAPVLIHSVEAEFSDEARRAKYQGVCLVSLIVDTQGNPQNIRVARSLGKGLDEKAIEAVRQYKFSPAMKDGQTPVPVMITIEVNFRLY
jgi:TonB family protein